MIWKRWDRDSYSRSRSEEKCFHEQSPITIALCSPTLYLTEAILLSDCQAGTDPSCFSATCMKLKQKESICNLLSEILNGAGLAPFSCGEGKMLASGRGDVCHSGATLCFAAPLARAACKHMSLIRQQQFSLVLVALEGNKPKSPLWKPPVELQGHADGSWRERNRCENQGDVLAAWQQQPVQDSWSTLSQKKCELNLVFLKKMADFWF